MSPTDWQRNRLIVLVTIVLVFGGFTMVIPFVPLYLFELGVTDVEEVATYSGIIISLSPLLAAFGGPLWGRAADKRGLRPMAMRVMLAFFIGWSLFGSATRVFHLILARTLIGLSGGFNALVIPMATTGCPPGRLSQTIGLVQSTRTASLALGPLIGGTLASWMGIRMTAYAASGLFVVAMVLIFFFFQDVSAEERARVSGSRPGFRELFSRPELVPLIVLLFIAAFADRWFGPLIPLLVLEFGASADSAPTIAGGIISAGALASSASALVVGRMAARKDAVTLLKALIGANILFAGALAVSSSSLELGIFRSLMGLMTGGILTLVYFLGESWLPPSAKATGMGLLTSGLLLGFALAPLASGLLTNFGLKTALIVPAPLLAVLLAVVWLRIRRPVDSDPT